MVDAFRRIAVCKHDVTVSVIFDGIEGVVCENCADLTFRYESMISGDVDRSKFARDADQRLEASVASAGSA